MTNESKFIEISEDFRVKDGRENVVNENEKATEEPKKTFFEGLNTNESKAKPQVGIPSHEYDKLVSENKELISKLEQLDKTHSTTLAELSRAKTHVDNARGVNRNLREVIKKFENGEDSESLSETYATMKNENKNLKALNKELKNTNSELEDKLEEYAVSSEGTIQSQMELKSLTEAHIQLEQQYEEMRANLTSKLDAVTQELEMAKASKAQKDSKEASVSSNLRYEKDVLRKELDELNLVSQESKALAEQLRIQYEESQKNIESLNAELESMKLSLESKTMEVSISESKVIEMSDNLRTKETLIKELQQQIESLQSSNDDSSELQLKIESLEKELATEREISSELKQQLEQLKEKSSMSEVLGKELADIKQKLDDSIKRESDLTNQLNATKSEVEKMKLMYEQFPHIIKAYNDILAEIKKHDEVAYKAFEVLFKKNVLPKPDLVKAILAVPE